jgi:hypothetical protein
MEKAYFYYSKKSQILHADSIEEKEQLLVWNEVQIRKMI